MRSNFGLGWWAVFIFAVIFGLNPAPVQGEPPTFDNKEGEVRFDGKEIKRVDGRGRLTLIGRGQDLTITEKKDGEGTLNLKGFGKITIKEKNGQGHLVIEGDNKGPVIIHEINGAGHTYIRTAGSKRIEKFKDGPGNVYYKGEKPTWRRWSGDGKLVAE